MLANNLDFWYLTQRCVKLLPNVFGRTTFTNNNTRYILISGKKREHAYHMPMNTGGPETIA